jgi:hypothetical protein
MMPFGTSIAALRLWVAQGFAWKKISTNVEFHCGGVDEDCGHGYEVQAQHFQSS